MSRIHCVVVVVWLVLGTIARAEEFGNVLVIAPQAMLKMGDKVIGTVPRGELLEVGGRNENKWLWVRYGITLGWLSAADTIPVEQAVDHFTAAIAKNAKDYDAYCGRARAYRQLGDRKKAHKDLTAAIELDPKRMGALLLRGLVYYEENDLERALADYTYVIQVDPKYYMAYINRGTVYADRRELEKADADFTQSIALFAKHPLAWYNRGNVRYDQKKNTEAVSDFTEAIKLNAQYARAYNNRGEAHAALRDYDLAAADYRKAMEIATDDAAAPANLAWILATIPDDKLRDPKQALDLAEAALKLAGDQGDVRNYVLNVKAAALAASGKFDAAAKEQAAAFQGASASAQSEFQERLDLYKQNKAYVLPAK